MGQPFCRTSEELSGVGQKQMKQPFDTLHVKDLVEASVDGFAENFYDRKFDELQRAEKQQILRAIAAQCREMVGQC